METHTLNRGNNTQLASYRWSTDRAAKAIVVIVHGMAEHAQRYAGFAEQLAAAGMDVYAFDLRGHGATTPAIDHGHMGTDTHWQTLVDDVEALRAFAIEHTGARPVILFGHSLGAFIAQATMQTHGRNYAGVVLSAPANPSRLGCRLGALVAAVEAVRVDPTGCSALLKAATFGAYERAIKKRTGLRRTRFDWLSSSTEAVRAYMADPQTGFDLRTASWQCLFPGMARTQSPHARRRCPAHLPLLIATGDHDPVGQFGKGPRRLANAYMNNGQDDVTLRVYNGARHELINDPAADTFTYDMLTWLAERQLIQPTTTYTGSRLPCDD